MVVVLTESKKVELDILPRLDAIAQKYGLEMKVCERPLTEDKSIRYYAQFDNTSLIRENVGFRLIGDGFGNGATPEEAISNYAKEIELKTLLVGSWGEKEITIKMPKLTGVTVGKNKKTKKDYNGNRSDA